MADSMEYFMSLTNGPTGYMEALNGGYKFYWSKNDQGELAPCKHGHLAPRITNNRICIICNRDASLRAKWAARGRLAESLGQGIIDV